MGIRLDWEVEAEHAYQRAGEDPEERSIRRHKRARILFFTVGMLLALCGLGAVVWFRLYTVDEQQKHDLVTTVQAEVATLRVGNYPQFMAIQRSAGDTWYQEQGERYQSYQDLKQRPNTKLTGNVVDAVVDGSRGRAVVEEIIQGTPYHSVWFYWRYADGWRHVPSDYTFWGESETITGKVSTVQYDQLDAGLAQALGPLVDKWWTQGCGYVGCVNPPKLSIRIEAMQDEDPRWDDQKPYTLIVPSPLASAHDLPNSRPGDRARADIPLSPTLEESIADMVAARVFDVATNNLQPVATSDAAWLRQSTIDWLSAVFVGHGDSAQLSFIQSLQDHYGTQGLISVLRVLGPTSDISIVGLGLNQPIQALALDWRMFFQWRLDVEKQLLQNKDYNGFRALWDVGNPAAQDAMNQRMNHPEKAAPQVQAITLSPGSDGVPHAAIQATANNQAVTIVFRLVNGAWKRIS